MKFAHILIILSILLCFFIPIVSAQSDDNLLNNITKVTLEVPPTGTAPLGTKESMTEYQSWLDESASRLITYCNSILDIFGVKSFDWGQKVPVAPTDITTQTIQETIIPTPTPAIPLSNRTKTIGSITGGDGVTSGNISIPYDYWELDYTVDPLVKGGQDSHSGTGSNSAVFPTMSIQITDMSTGQLFDTVSPDGQLDPTLWERSDPRPWYKRYFVGDREFGFVVTAESVKSFTIEVRVPVKTIEQSGGGVPSGSPIVTSTPQRTYIVAVNVFREGSRVRAVYQGGRDAASLQSITITANDVYLGEIGTSNGQTPLQIGTTSAFPVTCPEHTCYVIGMGHFMDGSTQKIFETTL
jgi:hypothetical protein